MGDITLGQKIKQARLEKRLSRQELVGDFITTNMLSKIENDTANPSIKTIEFLAQKLDKPVAFFLESLVDLDADVQKEGEEAFIHTSILFKEDKLDDAISYITEKIKDPVIKSDITHYPKLLYCLGEAMIRTYRLKEGRDILDQALSYLSKNKDYYYMAKTCYLMSTISNGSQETETSEELLYKGLSYILKSHERDILLVLKINYNLGHILFNKGEYNESATYLSKGIGLWKSEHVYYKPGETYMLLGKIYGYEKNFHKAEESLIKAISYFNLEDNYSYKASSQKALGVFYIKSNLFAKGRQYLNNALEYFQEKGEVIEISSIQSNMIEALVGEEDYQDAVSLYKKINIDIISQDDKTSLYINIGKCFTALNELHLAEDSLTKGENLLVNTNNLERLSEVYSVLADINSLKGNFKEAYSFSNKAKESIQKLLSTKNTSHENKRSL